MGRVVLGLLWLLFGFVLLLTGREFLVACGIEDPRFLMRNYCPFTPDRSDARREALIGESLRRDIHAAELTLARKPTCAPSAPIRQGREIPDLDQRVTEQGGRNGKLQFTLVWTTLDDLDLQVRCPGGEIGGFDGKLGPGICGSGIKDIDANKNLIEHITATPIENMVWAGDIPDGTYRIVINPTRVKNDAIRQVIKFTLRLRSGDEERTCDGELTKLPTSGPTSVPTGAATGTAQSITWTTGTPLPDCDFKSHDVFRAEQPKQ